LRAAPRTVHTGRPTADGSFTSERGPLTTDEFVRIANADGSNDHLVPSTDGAESASFSPDGRYIVFESPFSAQTCRPRIDVIRPNGTGLREITPHRQKAAEPSWSPDGTRIIYACSIYANPALASTGTGHVHAVSFPTPHAICEISRTHPKPRTLYSVPSGGLIRDPLWSADGKKTLVQVVDPSGDSYLALLNPSGRTPVEIPNSADARDPDW
jgi:dipeptidyl aminopeptidase/acylaminoacyl peptidase